MKTPTLKPIDLKKCCELPGSDSGDPQWHPDINEKSWYLAKIDGEYFAGRFSRQWYGWSFDGWDGGSGLQLDKPGTNSSDWQGLWEIVR